MYDITMSEYINSAHDLQLKIKNSKLNIVGWQNACYFSQKYK